MGRSSIEWTDRVWNPVTGCSKVSPGCAHCYAERHSDRLRRMGVAKYASGFKVVQHWDVLDHPLRWRKPSRVFVNSMSDLFHREVEYAFIDRVFAVMAASPQHTFQILTKRPLRMRDYSLRRTESGGDQYLERMADWAAALPGVGRNEADEVLMDWPLPNVWLGVSAENQEALNERIVPLLETPAAVRWLSAEPLLEEVFVFDLDGPIDVPDGMDSPLHWVVCGGESGPRARPMDPNWARSLRDQCIRSNVPFFFKQWGEWRDALDVAGSWTNTTRWSRDGAAQLTAMQGRLSNGDEPLFGGRSFPTRDGARGEIMVRLGKKRAGRVLDGRTWDEMPPMPARSGGRG